MGCSLKIEYPFIKHIPIVTVMSGSHVSGCAMMSFAEHTGNRVTHLLFACLSVLPHDERETSGYKYRVAPGTAKTGNGAILLSGHKVERDKTVATSGGSLERTSEG